MFCLALSSCIPVWAEAQKYGSRRTLRLPNPFVCDTNLVTGDSPWAVYATTPRRGGSRQPARAPTTACFQAMKTSAESHPHPLTKTGVCGKATRQAQGPARHVSRTEFACCRSEMQAATVQGEKGGGMSEVRLRCAGLNPYFHRLPAPSHTCELNSAFGSGLEL